MAVQRLATRPVPSTHRILSGRVVATIRQLNCFNYMENEKAETDAEQQRRLERIDRQIENFLMKEQGPVHELRARVQQSAKQ